MATRPLRVTARPCGGAPPHESQAGQGQLPGIQGRSVHRITPAADPAGGIGR